MRENCLSHYYKILFPCVLRPRVTHAETHKNYTSHAKITIHADVRITQLWIYARIRTYVCTYIHTHTMFKLAENLRRLEGVTRLDRVRNEDVRGSLGQEAVVNMVKVKQRRQKVRMEEMNGDRLVKRLKKKWQEADPEEDHESSGMTTLSSNTLDFWLYYSTRHYCSRYCWTLLHMHVHQATSCRGDVAIVGWWWWW